MRTSIGATRLCGLAFALLLLHGPGASRALAEPAGDDPAAAGEEAVAPEEAPAQAPARPAAAKRKPFRRLEPPSLSHDMQFGIALLPGSGYRVVFPYQENIFCGQTGDNGTFKRVCSRRVPIFVDVQPSFGLSQRWDLLVDLRFGLEADFTGTRQFAVAPGFRYWVDPELPVKFFATVQVAYDTTAQHNPAIRHNNDWAFRNSNGLMFEVMRNLGFYAQFGETIGVVRWLRFEVDLGLGVQARFP
jgi:hypothetical protein